jgi:hypothetical protein
MKATVEQEEVELWFDALYIVRRDERLRDLFRETGAFYGQWGDTEGGFHDWWKKRSGLFSYAEVHRIEAFPASPDPEHVYVSVPIIQALAYTNRQLGSIVQQANRMRLPPRTNPPQNGVYLVPFGLHLQVRFEKARKDLRVWREIADRKFGSKKEQVRALCEVADRRGLKAYLGLQSENTRAATESLRRMDERVRRYLERVARGYYPLGADADGPVGA